MLTNRSYFLRLNLMEWTKFSNHNGNCQKWQKKRHCFCITCELYFGETKTCWLIQNTVKLWRDRVPPETERDRDREWKIPFAWMTLQMYGLYLFNKNSKMKALNFGNFGRWTSVFLWQILKIKSTLIVFFSRKCQSNVADFKRSHSQLSHVTNGTINWNANFN